MRSLKSVIALICLLETVFAVKVKLVMHSEQDSKVEEDEYRTEEWEHRKKEVTITPFIKSTHHKHAAEKTNSSKIEEEKVVTTEKQKIIHPNEMIFPLIYKQSHINSMFKYGDNWYTWSTEKRTDGSKATNYYICYDEPKRCDDIGWERTDTAPKCAFQIESLLPDDRACINSFGVEPHPGGLCDGAEQIKVTEIIKSCGPRIRSLWRFVRVGRRPVNVPKPADVNSFICDDEEECFISIEYRIHHDRITFSLHEPTRGQTFKSALKRKTFIEEEVKAPAITESHVRSSHRSKKPAKEIIEEPEKHTKKPHSRQRYKVTKGKGIFKEHNDSGYTNKRPTKNKIKVREDLSEDISE